MAVVFKDLLSRPADSFEKPKPIPIGTVNGVITKFEYGESKEKKTPYVRYTLGVLTPGEDMDASDLEGVDLTKKTLKKDFYLTEEAGYRLKDFLASCGIEVKGRSMGEIIPDAQNASVIIEVTQRPSQDGQDIYNEVGNIKGA